jgi:uncharacterized protein YecT (DUF1311 family)
MNISAGSSLERAVDEMAQILLLARQDDDVDEALLDRSQDAWVRFADAEADLRAALVAGGSMKPMIWAARKETVTRERIAGLRWWLERTEGEF